jgi:hypothetical protein
VHNYDEFITTFLTMLAEQNLLGDLVQHGLGSKRLAAADREASTAVASATTSSSGNLKKHSGGVSKNTSTPAITLPNQPGSSGSSAAASQPVRNRKKKKKKYEESESDWSDEEALVPVNRGGFIRFAFVLFPVQRWYLLIEVGSSDCNSSPLWFLFLFESGSRLCPSYLKVDFLHSLLNFKFLYFTFSKEK